MKIGLHIAKAILAIGLITPLIADDHWAYQPIQNPTPPGSGTENPIDAFVLAKLGEANFKPSPEAPPHILLRRVHLDLTGLPPTPDEMTAFKKAWKADPQREMFEEIPLEGIQCINERSNAT